MGGLRPQCQQATFATGLIYNTFSYFVIEDQLVIVGSLFFLLLGLLFLFIVKLQDLLSVSSPDTKDGIWSENETKSKADISSSLASLARTLSSEIETLRKETTQKFKAFESDSTRALEGNISALAEEFVHKKIKEEIGEDIVSVIGKQVANKSLDYARRASVKEIIIERFDGSKNYIEEHAESAKYNARMFRRWGIMLAIGGIVLATLNLFVFYFELFTDLNPSKGGSEDGVDYTAMLKHLPFTLPFILLSEALALIMFRYQSKALEMMRYFSNEVTTLNLRRIGALTIIEFGDKKAITELATGLLISERNIILRKDEKTVELAQNRDEDAMIESIVKKVESVWKREEKSSKFSIDDN